MWRQRIVSMDASAASAAGGGGSICEHRRRRSECRHCKGTREMGEQPQKRQRLSDCSEIDDIFGGAATAAILSRNIGSSITASILGSSIAASYLTRDASTGASSPTDEASISGADFSLPADGSCSSDGSTSADDMAPNSPSSSPPTPSTVTAPPPSGGEASSASALRADLLLGLCAAEALEEATP